MNPVAAVGLDGCTVELGGTVILDQVDLTVPPGTAVAVRGANGSGKSTLLRVIAGLVPPLAGEVAIYGQSPTSPAARIRIGAAIDAPALYGWMSGRSYLRTLLDLAGVKATGQVGTALERFGLQDAGATRIFRYSQGMKKRLALAAATLGDPPIVLLDEPTNALDREGIDLVRRWAGEHRARGGTLVLASHRARDLEVCDVVVDLIDGALGPPEDAAHA